MVYFSIKFIIPNFALRDHEKACLIRVTINECKDISKYIYRKRTVSIQNLEIKDDGQIFKKDNDIMAEILLLAETYKAPIYLYYFDNYSIEEISKILKIGTSAVKMRLLRGREILKLELEETYYGERRLKESY